jgi:hypothetical protein
MSVDETRSTSDKRGGLNGSTQHWLEVYSRESENLKSFFESSFIADGVASTG